MSFSLQKTKSSNKKSKFTVFGYIHEHESLQKSKKKIYKIPLLIQYLCLGYYDSSDKWDKSHCKIDKNIANITSYENKSAFLTNIISKDKYKWKFKIQSLSINAHIFFSIRPFISETNYNTLPEYVFCGATGSRAILIDEKTDTKVHDYGTKCKQNDIIEMILDLNKNTLSFIINGINYGIAFNNILNTQYRAIVDCCSSARIELINSYYCD